MYKQILKSHADVMTVPETLEKMKSEYQLQGYECQMLANCLKIDLDDGYVMIYWENSAFWQECHVNANK